MKRFFLALASLLALTSVVQAQSTSGILFNRDIIPASSLLSLSQRESTGTARSMGMGGAFTSLGADMSSFGYNPAGFGMYQRNEISVSLGLGVTTAKNYNGYSGAGNSATRFSINNAGASLKVYEGTGKLVAVNFAFGYNKMADYNYSFAYESPITKSSLVDAFSDIANAGGLYINSDNKISDPRGYYDYDMNPYYWGAVMGYKGGLINRGANGWYPDEVGNANILQTTNVDSRGSAGEFSFAFGFNISNIVYLGASLDIQSISRKQIIYYNEYFDYADGEAPNPDVMPYQLQNFEFGQSMQVNGSGVGAKFGVVVRPVESLRIGFSVHTPTYYSIAYRYEASLSSVARSVGSDPYGWASPNGYVYADESTPILQDGGEYRWRFTTPTRLLAGVSYSFGPYAVISVDYQYDAYRSLKLNYAPADTGYTNSAFRDNLKGVHTVRAGVEAKPLPWLSLRVGGGYRSQVLKSDYNFVIFSEPIEDRVWYASAGLGFRVSEVTSIDLAYQYRDARYSDYYSFYTQNSVGENASPIYGLDIIKHNIALTFAFRF
ncbi:MAG: long-chain fatty acid transporter [Rikenellaceae bacterium]|nr:long-chain fatty acid transporter [Rikenellaceae bacterium]